jgi:hypothetical protein
VSARKWTHLAAAPPEVLDDQMLEFIVQHSAGISLNSALNGAEARYDYAALVQRIKDKDPAMPVLMYTYATDFQKVDPSKASYRIAENVLDGYADLGDLLMPEVAQGPTTYWGDVRKPAFRDWVNGRITTWVEQMGCDGALVDLTYMLMPLSGDAQLVYQQGVRDLFVEMQQALGADRLAIFNGLWEEGGAQPAGTLAAQESLLPSASGAMIEFFGDVPQRTLAHTAPVEPYLSLPQEYPDKLMFFNGRGLYKQYETYHADYLRQRYDYAAYLLLASTKTYFGYSTTFQEPTSSGRTGADAVFADWSLDLGDATGVCQEKDGLYTRQFERGLVALNPTPAEGEDGSSQTLALSQPMFDPEGVRYATQMVVPPGVGQILLATRPAIPLARLHIEPAAVAGDWLWATVTSRGLQLEATPSGSEWEHDLLLDGVRRWDAPTGLRLLARTEDPGCAVNVVVEVDDAQGVQFRAVVVVGTEPSPLGTPPQSVHIDHFRQAGGTLDGFAADVALPADGQWHSVFVDTQGILDAAGGRYAARRLAHMRIDGAMDICAVDLV